MYVDGAVTARWSPLGHSSGALPGDSDPAALFSLGKSADELSWSGRVLEKSKE